MEIVVPPVVLALVVGRVLVVVRLEPEPPPEEPPLPEDDEAPLALGDVLGADTFGSVAFVVARLKLEPAFAVDLTFTPVFDAFALEPPLLGCTVAGLNEPVLTLDLLLRP